MKLFRLASAACASALVFGLLNVETQAQAGASSASVSRTRTLANSGGTVRPTNRPASGGGDYYEPAAQFVAPDAVAVEEFVNYHKHRLPLPKVGQSVALDARWGNDAVSAVQPEAVLQIGFTTQEVSERTDLRPLNLSLVIDRSGSMAAADKMERVKDALQKMFGQLRETDIVSIVVFDTDAQILLPAQPLGDGYVVRRAVESIQPNGGTNINAGLMLGYREALKNFQRAATNRVILMTDGIANEGVTEPSQIAQNSLKYNREGVDLTTIGVGVSLDQDLLRTLAKSGRGLFHFVAENEDIEKVFVSEVQSLISPVARNVMLEVDFDPNALRLEKIYGYKPQRTATGVKIPLDDMNNGLTAVALLKFRAVNGIEFEQTRVTARLSYYDIRRKGAIQQTEKIDLFTTDSRRANKLLADLEVKKNYTIALLAQSLADMTDAARRGDLRRAESFLNAAADETRRNFPNLQDADINRVLNIVADYQTNLRAVNRRRGE